MTALRIAAAVALSCLIAACSARDSTRLRAQEPLAGWRVGHWSDDEILAYMRVVATTLAVDSQLAGTHGDSAPVRLLAQDVSRLRESLGALPGSVMGLRTPTPPAGVIEPLRAHAADVRRLRNEYDFELEYLSSLHSALTDVLWHLELVDPRTHTPVVRDLVRTTRISVGAQLTRATRLLTALSSVGS